MVHRIVHRPDPKGNAGICRFAALQETFPVTNAKVKPSYPLVPTVWMTVALTRGSAAINS
jgi:hypothetical protein